VSATLVRIPGHGSVLLDCGEGTWGALARMYGTVGAQDVLRDLRCVSISHAHGDHQLGLPHLLAVRAQVRRSPPLLARQR
jgi:ribonuclease Z